ncbi:cytochrome P450 [Hypoxylon sp. FL1150]|nr:cytochrome P450 [Hypoxylon sp. FL1150]
MIGLLALTLIIRQLLKWRSHRDHLSLPPGPKPLPIIGNLHHLLGIKYQWLQFQRWSAVYGPVMHFSIAGQSLIVLSTDTAARDLLAKRSARFSERPRHIVAFEFVTRGMDLALRPYNDMYRKMQKLLGPLLNVAASDRYRPLQDLESRQLLADLLAGYDRDGERGQDFCPLIKRTTGSIIYALLYGYRLKTGQDHVLLHARVVQANFSRATKMGSHLVDLFPVLNHLPRILYKAEGDAMYKVEADLHYGNFDKGLNNRGWNFSKQVDSSCKASGMPIEQAAWGVGDVSLAGLDTSSMAFEWFLVACVRHGARFVAKAQQILDEVVGHGRLPVYEDQPRLVYIDAIVQETLRWRPVIAGGFPHATNEEDTYMGFRIPAGSVVLPNYWAITRDESVFGADPDAFVPERWININNNNSTAAPLKDLPQTGFGFGRRVCTGQHVARNALFIVIARLLWAFDVEAVVGEGVDDADWIDGFLVEPKPFRAIFRPRGPWVRNVLLQEAQKGDDDLVAVLDEVGGGVKA